MFKRIIVSFLVILAVGFTFVSCDSDNGKSTPVETLSAEATPLTLENFGSTAMQVHVSVFTPTTNDSKLKYVIEGESAVDITDTIDITVPARKKISFYDDRTTTTEDSTIYTINCDKECYVYGNVMSLINSTDFKDLASLENHAYVFATLFYDNSNIKNHPTKPLLLPATTLANSCYNSMFKGCTGLTKTPDLPATKLAVRCYYDMFSGCTGLKTVSKLPAEELFTECYRSMFNGCTSLTSAPALPATTLAEKCYENMFKGCTALIAAPELPAENLVRECYQTMFQGCSTLTSVTCHAITYGQDATTNWLSDVATTGTFTRPSTATFWESDSPNGIPTGWTTVDL
ncbi:MAG: leucine-rich repeat protein [Spirochaetales bacterium]|nr:leucine-rich repeat protein [Spirochaetales bacterium]